MQGSLNSQPNKFVFKCAVSVQADAAICWRTVVDCKVVTPLRKLPASRRRCDNSDTAVIGIVMLMHVTEDGKPTQALLEILQQVKDALDDHEARIVVLEP